MAGVNTPTNDVRDELITPLIDSLDVSTANYAGGLSNAFYPFFRAGSGGRPISAYNVPGGGPTLPYQNSFLLQGIGFLAQSYYVANSANLLPVVNEKSSLSLVVGSKPYQQLPLREVTGGVWQASAAALSDQAAPTAIHDFIQSYGPPKAMCMMFDRAHYLGIAGQQNFELDWQVEQLSAAEITITTPAAASPIRLQSVLYGILRRPVQ